MQLARVIGTVVAVCKDELLKGIKLLVIQPVDSAKKISARLLLQLIPLVPAPEN